MKTRTANKAVNFASREAVDGNIRATVPAQKTGWQLDSQERQDFLHRIRVFPSEVAAWRKKLVEKASGTVMFPAVLETDTAEEIRARVDDGISHLREIARIVALLYGSPDLGNCKKPVDELVYIILSRKTHEAAYQASFATLKREFQTWDDLLLSPRKKVESLVRSGGLSEKKTDSLFGALGALRSEFGLCTLEPARSWPDSKLEAFLCSLPEISRKSAYCVMMYAFDRKVFPVDTHVGRLLTRLGPYRELGLDLEGLDHKQLQATLADLVPPDLRYSLHVNLVCHGRDVCQSAVPHCERCELRKLCRTYRQAEVARAEASDAPVVMDLFCGAGGLSEGFQRAGFRVAAALDMDRQALQTLKLNHPTIRDENVLARDITTVSSAEVRQLLGGKKLDVLIGAPPCQGFSHAGYRSKGSKTGYRLSTDRRNYLFEDMVRLALDLKPRLFLMENVPGMHTARSEDLSFLGRAAQLLTSEGGYRTAIWKLNASTFGVPQDRIRCFLAASRDTLPGQPVGDYRDRHHPDQDVDALPPVTLAEAIFDLPARTAGDGTAVERWNKTAPDANGRSRRYLKKFSLLRESRLIFNHCTRYNNERDLELYALLRPGEDSVHAIERHKRADLMRYRQDVFDDKYARLRADQPCKTIVSHLAKDGNSYIHPEQVRSISIREAARVQSFHDGYVFCGSPSDQWVQIGNAVPPVLAEAIARSFMSIITKQRKR